MSIYRDTNANVVFEHPRPGALTASVYRGDMLILVTENISPVGGKFTLPLTYVETQYDGRLDIVWTASGFERRTVVNVVTPLVPLSKIKTLFEDENKSNVELAELEATVRAVIESHTKQKFGYFFGTRQFVGTGGNKILLNERLNRLTAFNGGWNGGVKIGSDGWSVIIIPDNLLTVKMAPPEEFLTYVTHGVIRIPSYYIKKFNEGSVFSVTGEWGYDFVPEAVQEAAMLLANDFACNEVVYHDRYLESIKIQQDTIIYHPGAFRGTGNARADLLLADFKRQGMVVI